MANLKKNAENSKKLVGEVVRRLESAPSSCRCAESLKYAIVTDKKAIAAKIKKDLRPIIGKYI
jgi:5'-methylthioadenosine phosphorylase